MRIAYAEVAQETDSFSPLRADRSDFEAYGLYFGDELPRHLQGVGPIGGFLEVAAEQPGPTAQGVSQESLQKHRAAWTDEWLRRRKERLREGFRELGEAEQHDMIESFRQELKTTGQVQLQRRLDASGWQHRMVLGAFTKFYALRALGENWDKPSPDDILAIAAELAMAAQVSKRP